MTLPEQLELDRVLLVLPEDGEGNGEHADGYGYEDEEVQKVHDKPGHQQPPRATGTPNNLKKVNTNMKF